eukprot:g6354.t1
MFPSNQSLSSYAQEPPEELNAINAGQKWYFALATAAIFVAVVLFGSYLAKTLKGRISLFVLDLFNVGAAGMFMAMAFFHILPETVMELLNMVVNTTQKAFMERYLDIQWSDGHARTRVLPQLYSDIDHLQHHHSRVEDKIREHQLAALAREAEEHGHGHHGGHGHGHGNDHGASTQAPPKQHAHSHGHGEDSIAGTLEFVSMSHAQQHVLEHKLQMMGVTVFAGYCLILFFERVFALWFTPKPHSPTSEDEHDCHVVEAGEGIEDGYDVDVEVETDYEKLNEPDLEDPLMGAGAGGSGRISSKVQPEEFCGFNTQHVGGHHRHHAAHGLAAGRDSGAASSYHGHQSGHSAYDEGHGHGHGGHHAAVDHEHDGHDHSNCGHDHGQGQMKRRASNYSSKLARSRVSSHDLGCHGHDNHGHQHGVPVGASTLSAIFLMVALSLHGVFEGWAAASTFQGSAPWKNGMAAVVALAAHKWVEGFVLALSLLKAGTCSNLKFFLLNFLCSLSSPLGVVVHTAAREFAEAGMAEWGPYLNAFACGTLIYVGVTEIVPEVFECDTAKSATKALAKFLTFVTMGAALMVFLYYFHDCDHGSEGCPCGQDSLQFIMLKELRSLRGGV